MYMEKPTLRLQLVRMFAYIFIFLYLFQYFFAVLPWIANGAAAAAVWERRLCWRCGLFFQAFLPVPEVHLWFSGDNVQQAPTRKNHVRGGWRGGELFQSRPRDFAQVLCGTAGARRGRGRQTDDGDVLSLLSICLPTLVHVKRNNLRRLYNLPHLITILTSLTAWS